MKKSNKAATFAKFRWVYFIILCSIVILFFCSPIHNTFFHLAQFRASKLRLPEETSMNIGAGSGDLLYVTLKSDAGRNLLFAIDTGSPFTLLDKSLESSLGIRLGSTVLNYTYMSEKPIGGIYFAPKLYLGNARLATGLTIRTDDLHNRFPTSRRKIDGILGIDC
jgi:hypothetical protein